MFKPYLSRRDLPRWRLHVELLSVVVVVVVVAARLAVSFIIFLSGFNLLYNQLKRRSMPDILCSSRNHFTAAQDVG